MNPEDNIKNFFQTRLKENASVPEDWNTPSDDIWEKAKVSFPKEEKSRRPLILWFSVLTGVILISTLAFIQLTNNKSQEITLSNKSVTNTNSPKLTESKNNSTGNADLTTATKSKITTESNNAINQNINNVNEERPLSTSTDLNNAKVNNKNIIDSKTIIKTANSSSTKNSNNTNLSAIDLATDIKTPIITRESKSTTGIQDLNELTATNATTTNNTISNIKDRSSTLTDNKQNIKVSDESENKVVSLLEVDNLLATKIKLLDVDMIENIQTELIISPLTQTKKWEIGLSTSPLIFPMEKLLNADTIDNEITNIDFKYFGLNIPVTRILNRKWSISSGLYYKQGYINAQFQDEETLDIGDNISMMFDENSSAAAISIEDKSQEISINLKPDVEIIDGDVITINGLGQLDFNLIQIPLLANYHLRKNRFEYIFSLGASLDLARIEISDFDIALSKENRIITEPINFTPFGTNIVSYSLYGAIGTKYHFNEKINLSYSLKADLTGVIFSTHELGIHYRF